MRDVEDSTQKKKKRDKSLSGERGSRVSRECSCVCVFGGSGDLGILLHVHFFDVTISLWRYGWRSVVEAGC